MLPVVGAEWELVSSLLCARLLPDTKCQWKSRAYNFGEH